MTDIKLLSIVIPFFNSQNRFGSLPIIDAVKNSDSRELEFVLIDDGSEDDTFSQLVELENKFYQVRSFSITHSGPGGARNFGLSQARGKFVWFVDSDDSIDTSTVIEDIRSSATSSYDFIAYREVHNKILKNSGRKSTILRKEDLSFPNLLPPAGVVRPCRTILRKKFLLKSRFQYPEYTFFEDNGVADFFLLCAKEILISDSATYSIVSSHASITRNSINEDPEKVEAKKYERLYGSLVNFIQSKKQCQNDESYEKIYFGFWRSHVRNTLRMRLTRIPSRKWIGCARVLKEHRRVKRTYAPNCRTPNIWCEGLTFGIRHQLVNFLSFLLPDQRIFLMKKRTILWGKSFQDPYSLYKR